MIVRRFAGLDPMQMPAVLVANHGPFTWGPSPEKAVENAVVLEQVAKMAFGTIQVNPQQQGICWMPLPAKARQRPLRTRVNEDEAGGRETGAGSCILVVRRAGNQ